ncbi:MAG: hypothetical protein GX774_19805 [Armatimonadetes bacterium]|jgi:hypothetical protein|nr:hypothetical protein [Armatimonadota bacterium]
MDLRRWQGLYARAERAASRFFGEHLGVVCARCYEASEARHDPAFCCCRRTNFVPEILTDPLLGGLAEESLGHSLLPLARPLHSPGCAALGPDGCRLPLGRPDACHAYTCDYLYHCLEGILPPAVILQLQEGLEVFTAIREARRTDQAAFAACQAQVEQLEAALEQASRQLQEQSAPFAARKEAVIAEMLPPATTP